MENCIVQKGMTTVLHILVLLKEIIAVFPKAQLKVRNIFKNCINFIVALYKVNI